MTLAAACRIVALEYQLARAQVELAEALAVVADLKLAATKRLH
jgi:hypothetical protein